MLVQPITAHNAIAAKPGGTKDRLASGLNVTARGITGVWS